MTMKAFYIFVVLAVLILGAAPFYLLPQTDLATILSPAQDPLPTSAPDNAKVGTHDPVVIYDSYHTKIKSLDPATAGDTDSASLQGAVYEGLYAYHYLKRPLEVVPQLADGMPEVSADGLTYTIHLKRGIKFRRDECFGQAKDAAGKPLFEADGKPRWNTRELVADDFVYAFKRIADYHISTELSLAFVEDKIVGIPEYRKSTEKYAQGDFSRYRKENIAGIKSLDKYTLQIKLKDKFPQLLYVLAIDNYAPIPHELVEHYLTTADDGKGGRSELDIGARNPVIFDFQAMIGTGPFYVYDLKDGGRIVLKRNPEFAPGFHANGTPVIDSRCFYPTEGEGPRKDASGQIEYEGDKAAGLLADAGKRVPFVDVIYQDYVPEDNPMWQLFMTRQADTASIPADIYNQVITPDKSLTDKMAKSGIQLIKSSQPAVYWLTFNMEDPVLGKSRSLRQALSLAFNVDDYIRVLFNGRGRWATNIIPTGFEGHDEAGPSPYAKVDMELACKKLEDAKKELIAAGVIKPGDKIPDLRLDLGAQDEQSRRQAEFIQQQFASLGVKLNVEMQDWPTLLAKMHKGQCQIYASGWHADYPDPENFLQLFYTPNIKRGTNNSNYSNAEFDRLFEKASTMPPSKERTELYVRLIRKINEDCPILLLSEPFGYGLFHPWVHNVKPHPIGYGFGKYRRIDAELRRKMGGR